MKLDPERRRILINLDVEAVRERFVVMVGPPARPNAIEASLHRARVLAGRAIPRALRELSKVWLRDNGYSVPTNTGDEEL